MLLIGKETAMVQLFMLMLMAGPGPGTGNIISIRERIQAPTPVTDKWIIPPKIPDCRNAEETQHALDEKANGFLQSCDPPKSVNRDQRR